MNLTKPYLRKLAQDYSLGDVYVPEYSTVGGNSDTSMGTLNLSKGPTSSMGIESMPNEKSVMNMTNSSSAPLSPKMATLVKLAADYLVEQQRYVIVKEAILKTAQAEKEKKKARTPRQEKTTSAPTGGAYGRGAPFGAPPPPTRSRLILYKSQAPQ